MTTVAFGYCPDCAGDLSVEHPHATDCPRMAPKARAAVYTLPIDQDLITVLHVEAGDVVIKLRKCPQCGKLTLCRYEWANTALSDDNSMWYWRCAQPGGCMAGPYVLPAM